MVMIKTTVDGVFSSEEVEPRLLTVGAVDEAAALAADGTSPPSDLSGQADYRQHLARVLTRSAVLTAAGI